MGKDSLDLAYPIICWKPNRIFSYVSREEEIHDSATIKNNKKNGWQTL
jgi:hypothetical protein